ncbi:MAG TPA: clostripain-related cysteine peptidase [Treponemataceae bacterium]|nr:clostripain-related cysteine peptidase [Treponemataceae bacterium]
MKKISIVILAAVCFISCEQWSGSIQADSEKTVYTITHGEYTGGALTKSPEKEEYQRNEKVTLNAVEEAGYEFTGWTGTVESTEKELILVMNKNYQLTPSFRKIPTYTITLEKYTGGTIAIEPKKDIYIENEEVTLTAAAEDLFTFNGWKGTVESVEKEIKIVMDKDYALTPEFLQIPTYTVTVTDPAGGTVLKTPDKEIYKEGDILELKATPDAGYSFSSWKGDSDSSEQSINITITKNITVEALFAKIQEPNTYKIGNISIEGKGSVEIIPQKEFYVENETILLRAVPEISSIPITITCTNQEFTADSKRKEITVQIKKDIDIKASFIPRKWTYIVYMAADNDLESAAVQDFNELEAVNYENIPVSIIVLFDRSPSYDTTNNNWSGTRLYEIQTDTNGLDGIIRSKELTCEEIDLVPGYTTNINTGNYEVLKKTIQFSRENYPAEQYGLIVWGHGTGWRGASQSGSNTKAFAVDESAGSYMTNAELGKAVKDQELSIIGFDTCFGGILETAYEIKDSAQIMIASEGSVPAGGWDYNVLFSSFTTGTLTSESFREQAVLQFKNQYAGEAKCTISTIDLTKIQNVKTSFDSFTKAAADLVVSTTVRNSMFNILMNQTLSFSHNSYPSDLYVDIYSLSKKIAASYSSLSAKSLLLQTALTNAVTESWSSFSSDGYSLGVYFCSLVSAGVPSSVHSESYVRGSGAVNQSRFVLESTGWVPNKSNSGSLLDKLFYTSF